MFYNSRVPVEPALWKLYAIRYARHDRVAHENFLGGDPHDNTPMPIDYFVWAAVSETQTFVIDTGFDEAAARKRGRQLLRPPGEGLRAIGIDPETVSDVIITHMHYDHCGNHTMFPGARFHLQEREMQFATGRYMTHAHMRFPFDVEDVVAMVRRVFAGRVVFHNGEVEIAPGLSLHSTGGHSAGLQVVRAWTRRGWVVLASDAAHYYANMERGLPYPVTFNAGDALEAFRCVQALADSPGHVIPGHDPLVLERYPPPLAGMAGWVARLD